MILLQAKLFSDNFASFIQLSRDDLTLKDVHFRISGGADGKAEPGAKIDDFGGRSANREASRPMRHFGGNISGEQATQHGIVDAKSAGTLENHFGAAFKDKLRESRFDVDGGSRRDVLANAKRLHVVFPHAIGQPTEHGW